MSIEPVRSTANARVAEAVRLRRVRDRRRSGHTLLEGPNVLLDAVAAQVAIIRVFGRPEDHQSRELAGQAGAEWIPVAAEVLERLAPTEHPRGPIAVAVVPTGGAGERDLIWLEVNDPGNAGTLVRAAAAFGFDVAAPSGAVDLWAPKVIRAGAGGHFHTTVTQPTTRSDTGGFSIVTVVQGGRPAAELRKLDPTIRCIVLVGSEAHGLDPALAESADLAVTVPMPGGTESLNAAVAGAIVMYELALRHERDGRRVGAD